MREDGIAWLSSLERLGMKFGLDNIRALTAELEHPERAFRSLLIAGTNGKGSVTAMTELGLRAAGYRTGRYTSPHLVRLEERFLVSGLEVETSKLLEAIERVRGAADRLQSSGRFDAPPTFFETTTAAAFVIFQAAGVELAVLEVGLGGRLDATNVVEPIATAITTIDLDHQAQLGTTLEAIAAEKAGIVRPRVPVVIGRMAPAAEAAITRIVHERGARLVHAHDGTGALGGLRPALPGVHQVDNAMVALALLRVLENEGVIISEEAKRTAIEKVVWPGRLELRHYRGSSVLMDAAHNPAGAQALASYLRDQNWTDATLVFASMADKDTRGMLAALAPVCARIIVTTAPTDRTQSTEVLAGLARAGAADRPVEAVDDPVAALDHACSTSQRVVVAGSIFLIGSLRGILR